MLLLLTISGSMEDVSDHKDTIICYTSTFRISVFEDLAFVPFILSRLYNVLKPASPEEIIPLGEASLQTAEYSRKSMSLGSISSFAEALGERVISFDFAPPVADVYATTRSRASETDQEVAYPVFVLKENGDILYFNHRILQRR